MLRCFVLIAGLALYGCQPAFALPADWDQCMVSVLAWEGGFAQRPQEPGGCAFRGVSLTTLQRYRGDQSLTCDDLRQVTEDETKKIYSEKFGAVIGFSTLGAGYDCLALHLSIMFGPGQGTDERPGYAAFEAKAHGDLGELAVLAMRAKMYRRDCGPTVIAGKSTWFCRGWSDRFLAIYELSRAMQAKVPTP
jgi:lysozyme family protein